MKNILPCNEVTKILDVLIKFFPGHVYWKDKNCLLMGCNSLQARNMGFASTEAIRCTHFIVPNSNPHIEVRISAIHAT